MVEESKDLITRDETTGGNMEIDEDETMDEVDSNVARERQRCLGLNDEETIRSISKAKHRVIPSRVHGDARSVCRVTREWTENDPVIFSNTKRVHTRFCY